MKFTTYIKNLQELELIEAAKLNEVIIAHENFSRHAGLKHEHFVELAQSCRKKEIDVILEFDVIKTEFDFWNTIESFKKLSAQLISKVRVQDIGVLNWILTHTKFPVQLNLEGSNHNLKAIKTWERLCAERLDRLVLSIELSEETLKSYISQISVPVELMGLGRIPIFYSPRSLLTPLLDKGDRNKITQVSEDFLEATGESEESPHKGFPLLENRHGTFMFHIRRLNLLKELESLKNMKLDYLRLDFRFDETTLMKEILLDQNFQAYPHESIKGFFKVNKSDVLFKKLKNQALEREDEAYVGEVIAIEAKSYTAMMIKKSHLKTGDKLVIKTPEGKEKELVVERLRNTQLEEVAQLRSGQIALLPYVASAWVKSQIYKR